MRKEGSAEKVVQDIRRKTRRRFSVEEKIRIVLEGLRGEESIATLCRKEGLAPNLYYRWSKEFLEAGKRRLVGDTTREATSNRSHGSAYGKWPPEAARRRGGPRKPTAQKKRDGLHLGGGRAVRLTAAEKYEVIRLVEGSDLSVRHTLRELQVPRATFYTWYRRYVEAGLDGLAPRPSAARRSWNRIPPRVRQRVVDAALAAPERTPRELAWQFTDQVGHFLSESSVYRILRAEDLITSPAYVVLSAAKAFRHPTHRPNELWQTDFTYLQVVGWGWYYLSTVLDDYSRYILAWTLRTSMQASDVTETLDLARARAGVDRVRVVQRPRLLSDNGPCYLSQELATYLDRHGIVHTRGAPYHPMTQGKIERYHRSMKNVVKLEKYFSPWALERALVGFVEDYNHRRYHEALQNVTPADVYHGRRPAILARREQIKQRTLTARRRENLRTPHHAAQQPEVSLLQQPQWSGLV